jgi:hypothetical protein
VNDLQPLRFAIELVGYMIGLAGFFSLIFLGGIANDLRAIRKALEKLAEKEGK